MSARKISARDLRERQSDVLDQVCFKGANYIVTRHGKKAAAVVSLEDLEFLQLAREELEDKVDIDSAEAAYMEYLRTGVSYSLQDLKKELDIE